MSTIEKKAFTYTPEDAQERWEFVKAATIAIFAINQSDRARMEEAHADNARGMAETLAQVFWPSFSFELVK